MQSSRRNQLTLLIKLRTDMEGSADEEEAAREDLVDAEYEPANGKTQLKMRMWCRMTGLQ